MRERIEWLCLRERRENQVREEKKSSGNDAVWLSFGPARTRPVPDRTRPVPGNFFFGQKRDTPGVRMQRYPSSIRTHKVPGTSTAPILPYQCFLVTKPSSMIIHEHYVLAVINSIIIHLSFCTSPNYVHNLAYISGVGALTLSSFLPK